MSRTIAVALILCALSTCGMHPAMAEQNPPTLYDCQTVRAFVAEHGKVKALAIALERGATWRQIVQAKKCLARS
jgi:hypothetical protein